MREHPWISAVSYWEPERFVGSAWFQHAPFAFWLVDALEPRTIVELGTHRGFSFFAFCEAVKRLGLDTVVTATDGWMGDEHAGFYGQAVYDSVAATTAELYAGIGELHRGYFDDFAGPTPDGSVDLLHIDGRHRYEDVWHDFESWLPNVSDRGVVICHDTTEHKADFGVWKFWEEVRDRYPSFGFEHGHGLGVLAVGPDVPERMSRFIEAGMVEGDAIREFYHERGQRISASALARADADRYAAAVPELGIAQKQLRAAEQRIDDLESSTSWRLTAPVRRVGAALRPRNRG
ncbi:class I SAM-dependent methyltransferase [Agromyces sp. Marseille-Q5079]|uniref:class I SAM-dependent methyltransferase n=1 Tax=Agromyces sp. Marseille-Q5079 TaxID=3439059 RepID=UPI003D9CB69B